jgi:hypothetical protein
MQFNAPHVRRSLGLGLLVVAAGACGLKDKVAQGHESGASAGDVDQKTEVAVTDQERAAFTPPADSSITPQEVEAYLKTSLLQFDLLRSEAPRMHQQVAEMDKRGKEGGVLNGLRNFSEGMSAISHWADFVGGSYVRSARTLKYNPAEMEYVRERMAAMSGYFMTKPMQSMGATLRQQAQAMKGQPGVTDEQVNALLAQADSMDKQMEPSPAVKQNLAALHQARGNVSDAMWSQVGLAGGGMGLLALSGLGDPNDTATVRKMNEFRTVYTDALNNRVTAGMENKPADGSGN